MGAILFCFAAFLAEPAEVSGDVHALEVMAERKGQLIRQIELIGRAKAKLKELRASHEYTAAGKKQRVQAVMAAIREVEETLPHLREQASGPTPINPYRISATSFGPFSEGAKVLSIAGEDRVLMRPDGVDVQPFVLRNISTETLTDGARFRPTGYWVCAGRTTYTATIGAKKTVWILAPVSSEGMAKVRETIGPAKGKKAAK